MFYEEVIRQFTDQVRYNLPLKSGTTRGSTKDIYTSLLAALEDEETKRFIFDARQATLFGDIGEEPEADMRRKIRSPFPQFYCEFTEPILIGEQEPGIEGRDYLRSFYFKENAISTDRVNMEGANLVSWGDKHAFILDHASFFFTNSKTGDYIDRSIKINLELGRAAIQYHTALNTTDPTEFAPGYFEMFGGIPAEGAYFFSGFGWDPGDGQYLSWKPGWWERSAQQYASLTMWVMAYMMAKSVNIHEIPLTRQQRRWHEQHHKIPRPWHRVELKPKFSRYIPSGEEPGYHHNYRYDVVGHLRFNRHKLGDGSYNETIEWVPPHQRGLANEIYVPKTYQVKGRRRIDPTMKGYFGKQTKELET